MLVAIYSRKSVYTGKGESVENQIELCKQYVATRITGGSDAELRIYEDEGFSGKNMQRPRFQSMVSDSRKRCPDYIVCYRLDRVSRSVGDFAPFVEDLIRRNIAFVCIKEQFDTSTPMGKAMMYIASVFAQLERETIAERVRDNMLLLARTGRWLGGQTPTGFISEKVDELQIGGKRKISCKLKWNPQEITIARSVFEGFLQLRSLSGLCKRLSSQGVVSRANKPFSLPGLREILQNPVYCTADADARSYLEAEGCDLCFAQEACSNHYGLLSYNKRDYSKHGTPRQEKSHWIIAVGKHSGLISGKEWVEVQRILAQNKPGAAIPKARNPYALLSGLLRCAACGGRMFAKPRANSPARYDYICAAKLQGGLAACNSQNLAGAEADAQVCDFLQSYLPPKTGLFAPLEKLRKEFLRAEASHHFAENDAAITQKAATQMEQLAALCQLSESLQALTVPELRALLRILVQKIEWGGASCAVYFYGV